MIQREWRRRSGRTRRAVVVGAAASAALTVAWFFWMASQPLYPVPRMLEQIFDVQRRRQGRVNATAVVLIVPRRSADAQLDRLQMRALQLSIEHNIECHFALIFESVEPNRADVKALLACLEPVLLVGASATVYLLRHTTDGAAKLSLETMLAAARRHGNEFVLGSADVTLPSLAAVLASVRHGAGPWAISARDAATSCTRRAQLVGIDTLIGTFDGDRARDMAAMFALSLSTAGLGTPVFVPQLPVSAYEQLPLNLCPHVDTVRVGPVTRAASAAAALDVKGAPRPLWDSSYPSCDSSAHAAAACAGAGLLASWKLVRDSESDAACPSQVPLVFPTRVPRLDAPDLSALLPDQLETVVVTAVSADHYQESRLMFASARSFLARDIVFIVFDLGLRDKQIAALREEYSVIVVPWDPTAWPAHFANLRSYAWKAAAIYFVAALERARVLIWADASVRFSNTSDLPRLDRKSVV